MKKILLSLLCITFVSTQYSFADYYDKYNNVTHFTFSFEQDRGVKIIERFFRNLENKKDYNMEKRISILERTLRRIDMKWRNSNKDEIDFDQSSLLLILEGSIRTKINFYKTGERRIKYTKNYSEESVKNKNYKIRKDGFIPLLNEYFAYDRLWYSDGLYGNKVGVFYVSLDREIIPNEEKLKEYIQANLKEAEIKEYNDYSRFDTTDKAIIEVKTNTYTVEENEKIRETLSGIKGITKVKMDDIILPEKKTIKTNAFLSNCGIPECISFIIE